MSRVYEDARTGEKVFSYAVPVYQGDEITGVLTAKDSIEAFEDILDDKTAMNGYGYVHMIGKEGKFLIRSKNKSSIEEWRVFLTGTISQRQKRRKSGKRSIMMRACSVNSGIRERRIRFI